MSDRRDDSLDRKLENWAQSDARVSPQLETRISGMLARSLTPVRPLPSQNRLALTFFAVYAVCSTILIAILDKAGWHLMTPVQMAFIAAVLAGGGILFSFVLAGQMVPGSRQAVPFGGALGLSGMGVFAVVALLFPWKMPRAFVAEGWPCATVELVIAIPATLLIWALARRGALFASARLGACLTGLAVFLALMPLQFQCMFQQAPHLLVWHGGTAAILIASGALTGHFLGRRTLRA